ncbi:MAG: hypothetical protein ACHQRO_15110, partial [Vicinamibacteria bacterium]
MSEHLIVITVREAGAANPDVVERARLHGPVLVVDDGSSGGRGAALRLGFVEAVRRGVERVVTLEGDGRHDPDDIPRLLKAAAEAPGSLVIGAHPPGSAERAEPGAARHMTGFFFTWLTRVPMTDPQSGFRVYPIALLSHDTGRRGGDVLESEMLLRAAEHGVGIVEVAIADAEGHRARSRPTRAGVARGAFLAAAVTRRWAREIAAGALWTIGIFSPTRMRNRHRAAYQSAAPLRLNPAGWSLAIGTFVAAHAIRTVERGWRSPHAQGLRLAAAATAATPLMLALGLSRSTLAA